MIFATKILGDPLSINVYSTPCQYVIKIDPDCKIVISVDNENKTVKILESCLWTSSLEQSHTPTRILVYVYGLVTG